MWSLRQMQVIHTAWICGGKTQPCSGRNMVPELGTSSLLLTVWKIFSKVFWDVSKTQDDKTEYTYRYIRLIVTGISDTKKALVFLKQHFGDSSFQQTKERLKGLPLLIYSGLDTKSVPLENALDRWGMMYEKQQISLGEFLEDQAHAHNL